MSSCHTDRRPLKGMQWGATILQWNGARIDDALARDVDGVGVQSSRHH